MADNIKLKEGKAVGAFDGFVETWNYIVDFVHNLKGDGEESSTDDEEQTGIVVDRSVPGYPVIRGSSSGGAGVATSETSNFLVISDLRYDDTSHQLQKKQRLYTVKDGYVTNIGEESVWTPITGGQAERYPAA